MCAKNKKVDLHSLTKEELIKKIENQRISNADLSKKVRDLSKENDFLREMFSNASVPKKIQIAMDETMYLMKDVERLKNILKENNIEDGVFRWK